MAGSLRLGPYLKELRIHLCQTSATSQGVRDFVERHYVKLKNFNPSFPILIREASGISPRVYARYEFGREQSVPLDNKSGDEVFAVLQRLANEHKPADASQRAPHYS